MFMEPVTGLYPYLMKPVHRLTPYCFKVNCHISTNC